MGVTYARLLQTRVPNAVAETLETLARLEGVAVATLLRRMLVEAVEAPAFQANLERLKVSRGAMMLTEPNGKAVTDGDP